MVGGAPQEVKDEIIETAINTRSRKSHTIDISALPPGNYSLAVAIREGAKKRYLESRRSFQIVEKPK